MSARAALLVALLSVPLLAGASAPAASPPPRVWVVGDSLAAGAVPYLPRYLEGWSVRQTTLVGLHTAGGVAVVEARARALPGRIVVSLGTNDDPRLVTSFRSGVRSIVSAAGGRCIVWPTIVRPRASGASYARLNRVLTVEAALHRNLKLVDWVGMTRAHPAWLRQDGVHATAVGYAARAAAIARVLRAC